MSSVSRAPKEGSWAWCVVVHSLTSVDETPVPTALKRVLIECKKALDYVEINIPSETEATKKQEDVDAVISAMRDATANGQIISSSLKKEFDEALAEYNTFIEKVSRELVLMHQGAHAQA